MILQISGMKGMCNKSATTKVMVIYSSLFCTVTANCFVIVLTLVSAQEDIP
jgi:hypothetical protein